MRGPATGPDTAVPGCDEADDLGLAALPQWPLSGAIRDKTRPACRLMGALRYKTRPAHTPACSNRDKTRPAHTPVHPNRYKTRPAPTLACSNRYKNRHTPQKSPILAHFRPAGRKLSRFSQSQPQQGEFSLVVSISDRSKATCGVPPAAGFSHGARPPHGDHLLCPRKAHADTHTACISTMSHGDWCAVKEISPLLGIAPVGMKY